MFKGSRIPDNQKPSRPGDYSLHTDGKLLIMLPNGIRGHISKDSHEIIENHDKTITVKTLISVDPLSETAPHTGYKGYLENGFWRKI